MSALEKWEREGDGRTVLVTATLSEQNAEGELVSIGGYFFFVVVLSFFRSFLIFLCFFFFFFFSAVNTL